jgi:hypothetical protein
MSTLVLHGNNANLVSDTDDRRHPARRGRRLTAAFIALAVLAGAFGVFNARRADAAYSHYHTDRFAFWDGSGAKVYAAGYVDWYKDGWLTPVYRGQYRTNNSSYVILDAPGCLWAKVSFHTVTGTASWPPSGSTSTTSDGYYRKCGAKGTYIWLGGIAYASHTLHASTLCIGFSYSGSPTIRRFQACDKMWN